MKKAMLLLCLSLFATSQALAHVTNEETAYSDIALSQAAPDILLLDMLGIFSTMEGSRDFRPQEPLLGASSSVLVVARYEVDPALMEQPEKRFRLSSNDFVRTFMRPSTEWKRLSWLAGRFDRSRTH